ncbi:MAG: hypothetical protein MUD09_04030 [Desulfobacterales bacterium]|jgi:hypothetical protein|nr:hypothetical protein [Desulfobacterales bacterium]
MSDSEQADFQKQVNHSLKYLNEVGFGNIVPAFCVVYGYHEHSLVEHVIHWAKLKWLKKKLPENLRDKPDEEVAKEFTKIANVVLSQVLEQQAPFEKPRLKSRIREALFPALKYVSDDIFQIAKVTTPVLLSLSAAGTLVLPAQPAAYAIITAVIAKTGVSEVCSANSEGR